MLSTTSQAPAEWASSAAPRMSVTCMSGFVGVSTNTSFVLLRIARASAFRSRVSTKLNSSPKRESTWRKSLSVPP